MINTIIGMEFVHRPYEIGKTIAAIATAPGMGGIAIVKISGKMALEVGAKLFSGPVKSYKTHTAHFGNVLDRNGDKIDEALLLVMYGPSSFTGENTVEIQCHGGHIAAKKILEEAFYAGAIPAEPGEFTFKAFMNGKIDLAQAEAIQELISAKNENAFHEATKLLEGRLSKKIQALQSQTVHIAAILEAWVDFPEEGIEFATIEEIVASLQNVIDSIEHLLKTYEEGRKIQQGINLCIVGAPNVGKSSLMNVLLGKDRAIVTPIAGTTRDVLEDDLMLSGLHFRLLDTAGIRNTDDLIEKEGIVRSKKAIDKSDLILLVLDASSIRDDDHLLNTLPLKKTIIVCNKIDLTGKPVDLPFSNVVNISATTGYGIEDLKRKIDEIVWQNGPIAKEEVLLSHERHKEALKRACEGLLKTKEGLLSDTSPEFLTSDLREALYEMGTVIGTNVPEDILNSIFSQFCIGK